MTYLTQPQLDRLVDVAVDEGLTGVRPTLFAAKPMRQVIAGLDTIPVPRAQVLLDLNRLNSIERLITGHIPLQLWLEAAQGLVLDGANRRFVQELLAQIAGGASGAPPIPDRNDLLEALVHQDDTLPAGFLELGARQLRSIGRLVVWPFENGLGILTQGQHAPHLGTAWLITPSLVVTNYHVINARSRLLPGHPPPPAAPADLSRQASEAKVEFDFLSDGAPMSQVSVEELVAHDQGLDYAVLRLKEVSDRPALEVLEGEFQINAGTPVSVNILQHPGGGAMRVGLRNNLVHSGNETEIEYYTDTLTGSSGSPVQDDQWRVVALHKAARPVGVVSFQGKQTAVVNVGTRISKILEHLEQTSPAARQEIG